MVGAALVPPDYFTARGGTWPRPVSLVERPASSRVWACNATRAARGGSRAPEGSPPEEISMKLATFALAASLLPAASAAYAASAATKDFVQKAALGSLFEIQMSRLAQ